MSLPSLIFVAIPCFELITFIVFGTLFTYRRVFALTILISILAILFSQFRRGKPIRPAKGLSPPIDTFIRRIGVILLIIPGLLTDLAGFFLLFRPGRSLCYKWFCRRYCPGGVSNLPLGVRLAAHLFGLVPEQEGGYADPSHSESGEGASRPSSPGRAWNPYGRTETSADEVVEDHDPDIATAYNGDISHQAASHPDEEIIDVDFTVR